MAGAPLSALLTPASEYTYVAKSLIDEPLNDLAILRVAIATKQHTAFSTSLTFYVCIAFLSLGFASILISKVIARSIIKPLDNMADTASSYINGEPDAVLEFEASHAGPSQKLATSFNALTNELSAKINQVTDERNRLKQSLAR